MPYMRSALSSFPGPRPASRRLHYGYCKRREAGLGPEKEASSACCERLPEQQAGSKARQSTFVVSHQRPPLTKCPRLKPIFEPAITYSLHPVSFDLNLYKRVLITQRIIIPPART